MSEVFVKFLLQTLFKDHFIFLKVTALHAISLFEIDLPIRALVDIIDGLS